LQVGEGGKDNLLSSRKKGKEKKGPAKKQGAALSHEGKEVHWRKRREDISLEKKKTTTGSMAIVCRSGEERRGKKQGALYSTRETSPSLCRGKGTFSSFLKRKE